MITQQFPEQQQVHYHSYSAPSEYANAQHEQVPQLNKSTREASLFTPSIDSLIASAVHKPQYRDLKNRIKWTMIAQQELPLGSFSGHQVRQRWSRRLNPTLKQMEDHPFTPEEDILLTSVAPRLNFAWANIARSFFNSTRTDVQLRRRYIRLSVNNEALLSLLQQSEKSNRTRNKNIVTIVKQYEASNYLMSDSTPGRDQTNKSTTTWYVYDPTGTSTTSQQTVGTSASPILIHSDADFTESYLTSHKTVQTMEPLFTLPHNHQLSHNQHQQPLYNFTLPSFKTLVASLQ